MLEQPRKHLFLDLEDTVIEPVPFGWANTFLINIGKVKAFMAEFKPDAVHLFSFAVHDQAELKRFNYHVRPRLESALGIELSMCLTVDDDILPVCAAARSLVPSLVSFSDLVEFWGKQEAFRLFVQRHFAGTENTTVALLDDSVTDEDFHFRANDLRGLVRNIDRLGTGH